LFEKGKNWVADHLVIEMLLHQEGELFELLARYFRLRLFNHPSEHADMAWGNHLVALLGKVDYATCAEDVVLVVVLLAVRKVYSEMLQTSCFGSSHRSSNLNPNTIKSSVDGTCRVFLQMAMDLRREILNIYLLCRIGALRVLTIW
jgi:hypothetical protein